MEFLILLPKILAIEFCGHRYGTYGDPYLLIIFCTLVQEVSLVRG
jgi:hypothetical protein